VLWGRAGLDTVAVRGDAGAAHAAFASALTP
jgi:hypothetical protein